MNKLLFLGAAMLLVFPVLADDFQPAPQDQAVQQYQGFWKTDRPDPMNHVAWKLYIFRAVPQHDHPNATTEYLVAGLTSYSKKSYYVGLRISQLYNFLYPIPKRGDVILVSGRIVAHRHGPVALPSGTRDLDYLTMDLDNAALVPNEHFDPTVPPAPTPGASPAPSTAPSPVAVPH